MEKDRRNQEKGSGDNENKAKKRRNTKKEARKIES